MELRQPLLAYEADSLVEAHMIEVLLKNGGVTAIVRDDVPKAWVFPDGAASDLQKPQVWIEATDREKAVPILEAEMLRRQAVAERQNAEGPPIAVACEDCGKESAFPANLRGTVQECPHCMAYMDVGEDEAFADWSEDASEQDDGA